MENINNALTPAALDSLIRDYTERCRRELYYGSSDFAAHYARQSAHYALIHLSR